MRAALPTTRILTRLAALLCLTAFLCGASGIAPTILMVVGQLDDDHHLLVSSSGQKLQIRFHHAHEAVPATSDVSEPRWAERLANSPADHVIEFASPVDSLAQFSASTTVDHSLHAINVVDYQRSVPIAFSFLAAPHARPPPAQATWSRCLRSVCLLV